MERRNPYTNKINFAATFQHPLLRQFSKFVLSVILPSARAEYEDPRARQVEGAEVFLNVQFVQDGVNGFQ